MKVKELNKYADERGWLFEILRKDDDIFEGKFGQIYLTTIHPGVIKGWHWHEKNGEYMCCIKGRVKLVTRDKNGEYKEFFMGEETPKLIRVPSKSYRAIVAYDEGNYVLIINDYPYNKKKPDIKKIPIFDFDYDWSRKNG